MQNAIASTKAHGGTGAAPAAYAARVRRDADAWTDPLRIVLLHADDAQQLHHLVRGWPRPSGDLPTEGMECIVIFDDSDEPTIIGWKTPGWGPDA